MINFMLKLRLPLFFLGFAGFVVAERYLSLESYHPYLLGASLLLMALASTLPLIKSMQTKKSGFKKEAQCWRYLCYWMWCVVVASGFFLLYEHLLGQSAFPETGLQKVMLGVWLYMFIVGFFSGVGIEVSHANTGSGNTAEPKRIYRAALNWKLVGILLAVLICVNYIAAKKDKAYDWSYLKTTTPGESTQAMFDEVKEPVEIAVFYSRNNEVGKQVKQYFDFLSNDSSQVTVNYYDRELDPTVAEDFKVTRNGQVVMRSGKKRERIDIGEKTTEARKSLKKLDSLVQKAFLRLSQEQRRIYFTRGHGEMSWVGGGKDPLSSIRMLEGVLRSQNYSLRFLGLSDGSGTEIPDDAAAVVIAGPDQPFLQAEADALKRYLDKGGRLAVFLDVSKSLKEGVVAQRDASDPLLKILADAGIGFKYNVVANDKNFVSATKTPSDRWFIFSNTFSTHASVANLAKNDERAALIALRSGYFEVKDRNGDWKAFTTVRSLRDSFIDLNKNFQFDAKSEKRASYALGVAAEKKAKAEDESKGHSEPKESRVIAFGDSNLISDALIRNRANAVYALDSMRWLAGMSEIAGEVSSEEDVRIRHTNKEDAIWFNVTVVVMPLLVLLAGFMATRVRKRKKLG